MLAFCLSFSTLFFLSHTQTHTLCHSLVLFPKEFHVGEKWSEARKAGIVGGGVSRQEGGEGKKKW